MSRAIEAGPGVVPPPFSGEVRLDAPFEVPAEPLPPGLLPGGDDVIDLRQAALRILQRHYADGGWTALSGADFEENLLHVENAAVPRKEWDEYARIKLGRSRPATRARDYAETVRRGADAETLEALLAACRLSTYAGGPGLPDLVLMAPGKGGKAPLPAGGLSLRALALEEWTREQRLCTLLATLAGVEVRAVGPGAPVRFIPRDLLASILADPRARSMMEGLEAALAREREWLRRAAPEEAPRVQDEIEALEVERFRSPFTLLQRWLEQGTARWRDVEEHRGILSASHRARLARFAAVEDDLRRDPRFPKWRENPSPEALAGLTEVLGLRFGLGETRAKAFLLYLKDS